MSNESKGIVHVSNASTLGHLVQNAQRQMDTWKNRGYSVSPMPADDQPHVYDKPCPVCADRRCWRCDRVISYDSIGECWRDSDEGAECQPGSGYDHTPTNPED